MCSASNLQLDMILWCRVNTCSLVGALFVVAGVMFDKDDQSPYVVFASGVLPGTRYALCQHMRQKKRPGKEIVILSFYIFGLSDTNINMALLLCTLLTFVFSSINLSLLRNMGNTLSSIQSIAPAAMIQIVYVVAPSNRSNVGDAYRMKQTKARQFLRNFGSNFRAWNTLVITMFLLSIN